MILVYMELRISALDHSLLEDYFLLSDLLLYRQQKKNLANNFKYWKNSIKVFLTVD